MSFIYQILGKPGYDNALFLQINSGGRFYRLLFDCGENVLETLDNSHVKNIDFLFLSHLHIDHISGFDYFFRRNYDREKPVQIFGPPQTIEIIHNRLRGFIWNWVDGSPGEWIINEISGNKLTTSKFLTKEAFAYKENTEKKLNSMIIFENEDFIIETVLLNHSIPSAAYRVSEKPYFNINEDALSNLDLPRGAWLERLRNLNYENGEVIELKNRKYSFNELKKILLYQKERDSITYLTDFVFDENAKTKAVELMRKCKIAVCECEYSNKDYEHAIKNFHLTAGQAADLTKKAEVEKLFLFHISDRYKIKDDYPQILQEARAIFPDTYFPAEWNLPD